MAALAAAALLLTVAWNAPARAAGVSAEGARALAPEIVAGPDGSLHVVWIQRQAGDDGQRDRHRHASADDVYYARSGDGGRTFSAPLRVNSEPGEVWGFAVSKPRIEVDAEGIVHVAYPANAPGPDGEPSVVAHRYTRSTDGGQSFESARTLSTLLADRHNTFMHGGVGEAHAFGTITVSSDGRVYAYWIDTRHMTADGETAAIYGAVSADHGATFGEDFAIYETSVCPCCQLTAVAPDEERVLLGLRWVTDGNVRDPSVAISTDGGRAFGAPARLGEARWRMDGCPLKPTTVAVHGDHVYTTWYSAVEEPPGVWFTRSTDGGASWNAGVPLHPAAAVSDAADLAVAPTGEIAVVWHAKAGKGRQIFFSRSAQAGERFSSPAALTDGESTASLPAVAVAGAQAHVVWQADDRIWHRAVELRPPELASGR
jgi:hypothetical protein